MKVRMVDGLGSQRLDSDDSGSSGDDEIDLGLEGYGDDDVDQYI